MSDNNQNTPDNDVAEDDGLLMFTMDLEQVPIRMRSETGVVKDYALVEIDGTARDNYMNSLLKRHNVSPTTGELTTIKTHTKMYADLLKLCLHTAKIEFDSSRNKWRVKELGPLLTEDEIQALGGKLLTDLYRKAQKINALGKDAKETEKKD